MSLFISARAVLDLAYSFAQKIKANKTKQLETKKMENEIENKLNELNESFVFMQLDEDVNFYRQYRDILLDKKLKLEKMVGKYGKGKQIAKKVEELISLYNSE